MRLGRPLSQLANNDNYELDARGVNTEINQFENVVIRNNNIPIALSPSAVNYMVGPSYFVENTSDHIFVSRHTLFEEITFPYLGVTNVSGGMVVRGAPIVFESGIEVV